MAKYVLVYYPGVSWPDVAKAMAETGLVNPVKVKEYDGYPSIRQECSDRARLTPAGTCSALLLEEFYESQQKGKADAQG